MRLLWQIKSMKDCKDLKKRLCHNISTLPLVDAAIVVIENIHRHISCCPVKNFKESLIRSNLAQIRVNLVSKGHRNKTSHEIAQAIYKQIEPLEKLYPGTRVKLFEEPPGPPVQAQVLAELHGPNYNLIASEISALLNGFNVTSIHSNTAYEPQNIIIRLKKSDRSSLLQIMNLQITLPNGKSVALSSLASVEKAFANKPIFTKDQHNVVYIEGDLLKSSPIYAVLTLNKWLDNNTLPNGVKLTTANLGLKQSQAHDISHYQILWGGEMRLTLDVFRDLGGAFIVALLFIYLILVAYYKSFMMPFIIMIPIPLTLIGVFWDQLAFSSILYRNIYDRCNCFSWYCCEKLTAIN